MTTLTEATAPERAYQRRADAIVRSVDALTTEQVRAMLGIVADVRRQVVDDLLRIPQDAGTWPAFRLRALLTELDQAAQEIAARYGAALRDSTGKAWGLGAEFAPDALGAAGIDLGRLPAISRAQLEVAMQLHGDLIKRVTQDFRTKAAAEVTRVVLGGQTPYQATQAVQRLLATQANRGVRGGLAVQAETIMRTETMTAFSLANQARQEQVGAEVPALRKRWLAASDGRTRSDHATAGRRYAAGGEPGPIKVLADFVVGGEKCRGPHDPRLSARNRVKCRCVSTMWHSDWGA